MKKTKKMLIFSAIIALSVTLASCNDKKKVAEKIQGAYTGYTLATSSFFVDLFTPDEKLTLQATGDNTVNLTFNSPRWGTFKIEGAEVTHSGNEYAATGSGSCELTTNGSATTHNCTMSATIHNTNEAVISFKIPSVMNGTEVVFHTGKASTGHFVAGKYSGNLVMSVSGQEYGNKEVSITLKGQADNKASFVLPAMGEGQMSIPEITVTDINVTTSDYQTFSIPSQNITFTAAGVSYTGTIEGNEAQGSLHLKYSLKPGAMPMSIDFVFTPKAA